jgi:hypothetical protein
MMRTAASCLALLLLTSVTRAQPAPPAPPPTPEPTGTEDDTESDDAPVDAPADDAHDKHDKHGKHDKHDSLQYKPREGITVRAGKARIRFFLGIETVLLYGHCAADAGVCESTDFVTTHVRRARFETEARVPHHLSIEFALQVKNEILVLKKASLAYKRHGFTLRAGFLKPPGGMERDSSTWVKPFPERSVVANFKQDRILGVETSYWVANHTVRLQGAVGRPPAGNFDAFEPEDVVLPPPGVEPEDLTQDPGNWDLFATGAYVPSDNFEVGVNTTAHIAPDAGKGPNFAEPYETKILPLRYFKGVFLAAGADVVYHSSHVRASAEVVAFHSGETIPQVDAMGNPIEPTAAPRGVAGYAVLGVSPCGKYGPAIQNAPLLSGYQLLLRGSYFQMAPGVRSGTTARWAELTGGVEWQVHKQLRLQTDLAFQKFNEDVAASNRDAIRIYGEVWAQLLL